jgi:hypothetical protein
MVGHTVDHDTETESVSLCKKGLEISHCTELRIDGTIILDCIVRSESTLAAFHSDRMDRHEPKNVDSKLLETRKLFLCCCKSSLRSILTYVHFIHDAVLERLLNELLGLMA